MPILSITSIASRFTFFASRACTSAWTRRGYDNEMVLLRMWFATFIRIGRTVGR
jgi:hypothetical protein